MTLLCVRCCFWCLLCHYLIPATQLYRQVGIILMTNSERRKVFTRWVLRLNPQLSDFSFTTHHTAFSFLMFFILT